MTLEELRRKINAADGKIVALLNQRARLASRIGEIKRRGKKPAYVPEREREVFDRLNQLSAGPLPDRCLKAIYRELMSGCLALEAPLKVCYFGEPGSFTHQAARIKFGAGAAYRPVQSIDGVFGAVERGRAACGIVPVENSTEGGINATLNRFAEQEQETVKVCAEIRMVIHHCLLVGHRTKQIRRVYSHPNVFGQCRRWLANNLAGAVQIGTTSTTAAAALAAKERGAAAVAGEEAARIHRLKIQAREVEDLPNNVTRFFVLGQTDSGPSPSSKTALLFSVKHEVGSLVGALDAFKRHGLNLTRIESRPSRTHPWEYIFFVDVEGHRDAPAMKRALKGLERRCRWIRILGSFPVDAAEG